ncbi:MAG: FHA domain-containing protein [Kofleriaceae bacterium]|nr:FHA domain-containing protein [Kofleriaceae bacterium]MCL4224357.1 FHA domain-containing protein [Myxococcales bacterium]
MSPSEPPDDPPNDRPAAVVATPVQSDTSLPPVATVTALRACARNVELSLSTEQASFTFGAAGPPEVDLTLEGEGISRLHAIFQRRGPKLRILDQRSTNGTYYRDRRDMDFEIAAGDVFEVTHKRIRIIALDESLRLLRPRLQWAMGLRAHAAVDQALEDAASGAPLLLVGPRHCEQRALAEEIHRRSAYRHRDFVASPFRFETPAEYETKLEHAERSSLYLDLTDADPGEVEMPGRFVARLFGGTIRPIVVARDQEQAQRLLGADALGLRAIRLPPLDSRREEIPRLLDALLLQAGHGPDGLLPLDALGEANVGALKAYAWTNNFDDVRRIVPRLHSLLTNGLGLRASARAYGCSLGAQRDALKRLGIRVTGADDDSGDDDDREALGRDEPPADDGPVMPLDPPTE